MTFIQSLIIDGIYRTSYINTEHRQQFILLSY